MIPIVVLSLMIVFICIYIKYLQNISKFPTKVLKILFTLVSARISSKLMRKASRGKRPALACPIRIWKRNELILKKIKFSKFWSLICGGVELVLGEKFSSESQNCENFSFFNGFILFCSMKVWIVIYVWKARNLLYIVVKTDFMWDFPDINSVVAKTIP